MSENQHSHVIEESLQENKEIQNEEKSEDEFELNQRHSSEHKQEVEEEEERGKVKEYLMVDISSIYKEIECPICLGIIRNTSAVMECLHRFCRECIHKSMRHGNKKCPTCRAHCPSKRFLRDDPSFDAIIQVMCPNIDKFEKEELASIEEELNLSNNKVP